MTLKCKLCEREIPNRNQAIEHHLTPIHKGGRNLEKVFLCKPCGQQVHKLFSNKELKDNFNTLDKLLQNEKVIKWINWIKTKNTFNICMKTKK